MTLAGALRFAHTALSRRWVILVASVAGALVTAPALARGWKIDDFIHRRLFLGDGSFLESIRDCFAFVMPDDLEGLREMGAVPWWTSEDLRVAFFRPLSALTHWFDYHAWPDSPAAMHAHSIVWYALACGAVTLFYRRFIGVTWIAGLAGLLFALDEAHMIPAEWIANRNALVALVFACGAIVAHDRCRREAWRAGAWIAPALFAASTLAAEAGIATGAYITAHALVFERGSLVRRLRPVLPYVGIVIVWRLGYSTMGFGAFGSELYVDPGREPLRFLAAFLERAPVLLAAQLGGPDATFFSGATAGAARTLLVVAWGFVAVAALLLAPLLRRDPVVRFWAIGAVLAVVPSCGMGIPSGRLLVFCGVGVTALLARVIAMLFEPDVRAAHARWWRVSVCPLAVVLVGVHGIWSPIELVRALTGPDEFQSLVEMVTDVGPTDEQTEIVVVNAPCVFQFSFYHAMRDARGLPYPRRIQTIAPGQRSVEIERLDARTVAVRPACGWGLDPHDPTTSKGVPDAHIVHLFSILDRTHRGSKSPVEPGQRFTGHGLDAEITAISADGRPLAARIRFEHPLEHPSMAWKRWDWTTWRYEPFPIPVIGARATLPGPWSQER